MKELNSVPLGKMNQILQRTIVNIFFPINYNICFGCSKNRLIETVSFEHPQRMFSLRNKKNILWIRHSELKDWRDQYTCL